jgi:hypothetical protein
MASMTGGMCWMSLDDLRQCEPHVALRSNNATLPTAVFMIDYSCLAKTDSIGSNSMSWFKLESRVTKVWIQEICFIPYVIF